MPRYIDADKLESLCDIMADKCDGIGESIWNQFRTTVEWTPTVDAVEVVRCKDCIHKYSDGNQIICQKLYFCDGFNFEPSEDAFCSYGERREDGHND